METIFVRVFAYKAMSVSHHQPSDSVGVKLVGWLMTHRVDASDG